MATASRVRLVVGDQTFKDHALVLRTRIVLYRDRILTHSSPPRRMPSAPLGSLLGERTVHAREQPRAGICMHRVLAGLLQHSSLFCSGMML
ncbi:hypothetical protein BH23GEM5_BH23GEM5_17920 [soil metagenome]